MFFSQSSSSQERRKQPHQLFEKILSKPQKGLEQLREYLQIKVQQREYHEIESIINYVSFRNTHQVNAATRIILIQCLQIVIMQIKEIPYESQLGKTIPDMITLILNYFKDPFEKVRFQAIISVYNIITLYNEAYLPMFTNTFNSLLSIINDEILDIKVVVFHLNHCLKKLLNLLIQANLYFDVNQFMALLIENFITESTLNLKEFLIDWLIAIDQIPEFQISFYLPLVFKELFKLLQSENQAIRDKSEECLKNFLSGFKELLRNKVKIEKKIRQDSFSMLMSVLLEVVKESINPKIKYHSLEWLEVFTQLFYNELIKKDHVEVRRSFRSEYLLKQMKGPKNHDRTSKILSFIREQMVENDSELGSDSMKLMTGIDFLPTPRNKDKVESLTEQNIIMEQPYTPQFQHMPTLQKAVTNVLKTTEFFVEVFLSFYDKIIVLVMHSFSDDDEKIRKITTLINNILLQSYPIVQQKARNLKNQYPVHTIISTQSQSYLQKLQIPLIIKLGKFLKESRTTQKIEAIIKWIKILYQKGLNPQLNLEISQLIQKIVQKICEKPVTQIITFNSPMTPTNNRSTPVVNPTFAHGSFNFNKGLFNLLADSIFMQKYLDLFIETLLSYFYQNQGIDFERILIDVISMKIQKTSQEGQNQNIPCKETQKSLKESSTDSTQLIYITILKRLMLFEAQKGKFKKKMIQNMISILITQNSLSGLRKKLRSTSIRQKYFKVNKNNLKNHIIKEKTSQQIQILELIQKLFQYFCLNQGFTIIFCFLTGMYSLINKILKYIAEQNLLDRPKIKSFIKASNLLECYNLNHSKLDILQNYVALKAYLGYLMVIPPSKLNKVLLNRFPQNFSLNVDDPQNQQNTNKDDFEQKLFLSYIKIVEKYKQDVILMEKLQVKRKQRERQASITLGIFNLGKELTNEIKPKSKSILKATSKVLKQSQSEKNFKPSPSFYHIHSSQSHKKFSFGNTKISMPNLQKQSAFRRQEQHIISPTYSESQTPYQLSDESLQFGGSESGLEKEKNFCLQKSSQDLQIVQRGQKKRKNKKELTIRVVDMQID